MQKNKNWSTNLENKITITQKLLSLLSLKVREEQFKIFWRLLKPETGLKILDVGVRADETLADSNFFEKKYPFPENLTATSVEDCSHLTKKYPRIKFAKILSKKPFPFANGEFDIVVSWATLEHVGQRVEQKFFLSELFRVGKKLFVTTPDKSCFYEPHSGLFFAHWLPHKYFSLVCEILGKKFWSDVDNLNPLSRADIFKILPTVNGIKILNYKMLGLIPSHLIVVKTQDDKKKGFLYFGNYWFILFFP